MSYKLSVNHRTKTAPRDNFSGAVDYVPSPGKVRFFTALLVLCLILFFSAWIYPPSTFDGLQSLVTERAFGAPFQYMMWVCILLSAGITTARLGITPYVKALTPFFPFLLVGTLAAAFGYAPFISLKLVITWFLMAVGAVTIGTELSRQQVFRTLLWTFLVLLLASTVLAVALPNYGAQLYGAEPVWRGLFTNKNQLGWVSALALVIAISLFERQSWWKPAAIILLATLCLVASGSKGALVTALLAVGYGWLMRWLANHVTPGFGVGMVLVGTCSSALMLALTAPTLLQLMGRDVTLTGRTDVWRVYFNAMSNTPWLGEGPGAYTGMSDLTTPLAQRLTELGAIYTPHNSFLGVFGDTGLLGLTVFLGFMVYLSLIEPLRRTTQLFFLSGAIGFLIMAGGMVETHEIYGTGAAWFLLILMRTLAVSEKGAVLLSRLRVARLPGARFRAPGRS